MNWRDGVNAVGALALAGIVGSGCSGSEDAAGDAGAGGADAGENVGATAGISSAAGTSSAQPGKGGVNAGGVPAEAGSSTVSLGGAGAGAGGGNEAGTPVGGGEGDAAGAGGGAAARVCVPETEYCGPAPCVQNSAGCVDHKCLPALPLNTECQDSQQCATGFCDAETNLCAEAPFCGCDLFKSGSCGAGRVCIDAISLDFCGNPGLGGTMCISSSPLSEGERCDSDFARCPEGMMCWDDNMTGQEHCVRGWLHAGDSCYDLPNNPSALCEPDLHCNLTTGMCEPNAGTLGGACPCQTGLTCGDDQKCHPGAAKGESCEQIVCGKGLRCATVATQ